MNDKKSLAEFLGDIPDEDDAVVGELEVYDVTLDEDASGNEVVVESETDTHLEGKESEVLAVVKEISEQEEAAVPKPQESIDFMKILSGGKERKGRRGRRRRMSGENGNSAITLVVPAAKKRGDEISTAAALPAVQKKLLSKKYHLPEDDLLRPDRETVEVETVTKEEENK